jgi:hypothetical protein
MPKYPDINIPLIGEDGNAFAILGRVARIARNAGLPKSEIDAFQKEATSGDYNHLLATVVEWFGSDGDNDEWDDE